MANSDLAFLQLFWDLINRRTGEIGKVAFVPQKPSFESLPASDPLPRSTPEAQGIDSAYLARFVQEMAESPHVGLQGLLIARHGHVIYEGSVDPYPTELWHTTYSMCKSFTGMAIGLLVDDGLIKLEDRASDILSKEFSFSASLDLLRKRDITIRDLLTMSSGVAFNETGAISGNDWLRSFFAAGQKFDPGKKFEYNSMNSFVLAAVVTAVTGKSMSAFLQERLFEPMGIRRFYWETSPTGITKAGWGLYITREDAAKLGFLYQHGGVYNGTRYLSEEWVREAVRPQIDTDKPQNPYYGYQLWPYPEIGCFTYNGMLGQDVFNFPALDLVVAVNAGNDEVFGDGHMTRLVRRYFQADAPFSDTPLPENPVALQALRAAIRGGGKKLSMLGGWNRPESKEAASRKRWHRFLTEIDGHYYELKSKGIGLMPLLIQVVHYNHTKGISHIGFETARTKDARRLILLIQEGESLYRIPVGFSAGIRQDLIINGEPYQVGVRGRVGENEDGLTVLTLEVTFTEETAKRIIKVVFERPDRIRVCFSEKPADEVMAGTLEMITTGSGNTNRFFTGILEQISPDLIAEVMADAIEPKTTAVPLPGMWSAAVLSGPVTETKSDEQQKNKEGEV